MTDETDKELQAKIAQTKRTAELIGDALTKARLNALLAELESQLANNNSKKS